MVLQISSNNQTIIFYPIKKGLDLRPFKLISCYHNKPKQDAKSAVHTFPIKNTVFTPFNAKDF
jgi:hypothetical protein